MTRLQAGAGWLVIACLWLAGCQARRGLWNFEPRAYVTPLTAGVRDANVAALGFGRADRFNHQVDGAVADRTERAPAVKRAARKSSKRAASGSKKKSARPANVRKRVRKSGGRRG